MNPDPLTLPETGDWPTPGLREYLRANMFDGDEGGTVTMPIRRLLDEVCELTFDAFPAYFPPRHSVWSHLRFRALLPWRWR